MRVSYGWVVVAAGMLLTCIGMGSIFSLAVFLQPIAADTGWTRTGTTLDGPGSGFVLVRLADMVGDIWSAIRSTWNGGNKVFW